MQKSYLRTRWLDLVIWHDVAAARANRQYYRLRITTLVGGATATAFASLKLSGASGHWVSVLIFALTLTVTIAAGLEELLKYGERGRNYRQIAERLKQEGWFFFQLAGPYHSLPDHQAGFTQFAERVEEIASDESTGSRQMAFA